MHVEVSAGHADAASLDQAADEVYIQVEPQVAARHEAPDYEVPAHAVIPDQALYTPKEPAPDYVDLNAAGSTMAAGENHTYEYEDLEPGFAGFGEHQQYAGAPVDDSGLYDRQVLRKVSEA